MRSSEYKCVTNSHALIWVLGRAIVSHFHMHLWSTHDCIRGRRMNRDVRLSYAVISHTLISRISISRRALLVQGASLPELMNTRGIFRVTR